MTENLPEVQAKARGLRDYMNNDVIKKQFAEAIPKWLSVDRFLKIVFGALIRNPRLMDCTKESLLQSVMQCAQLGLEPILGRAYLIPYNNNKNVNGRWVKTWEVQMQVGYQGFIDLVRRSGEIANIASNVVFERDKYTLDLSLDRVPHEPYLLGDRGKPIFAYTAWTFKDGIKGFDFMTLEAINKRRDKSPAWQRAQNSPNDKKAQSTPWVEWPEEMMQKTCIKSHTKMLPMSIDFMEAVAMDNRAEFEAGGTLIEAPSATLTLPESTEVTKPTTDDFDREFADISGDKKFAEFFELGRGANSDDNQPPLTDSELKILIMTDKRGPGIFRQAFESFAKKSKPAKKPEKKTPKGRGAGKKSPSASNGAAKTGKKSKAKAKTDENDPINEYEALQQSDDWQEMGLIFETKPGLFKKYNGGQVKTFDEASEFLRLVTADPDYKDEIPGA
jgi:phage RecT family recombinase